MATGFSFGAKTTATPTFGTGSITFGTPAAQTAPQFGFGTLASSGSTLFGTQAAPTTSALGFKPTGFGAPTVTSSSGFTLGGAPGGSGFSFGTPTPSAPATGLTFGTPTASTGLNFGTPPSSAANTLGFKPPVSTGLSFGTPASSTGLTFGTPSTSTALGFGTPISSTGTGLTFGTPSATPSTGLSFGAPSSSAPSLGLGLGSASTATTGLSFGGATATSLGLGSLGSTSTPTLSVAITTTPSIGLGGIATTQSKTGTSASAQKEVPPKEQPLPNEFLQLVEQFKTVVQEGKNRSSEVARCSVKEFCKVETELDSLQHQFNQVENQLLNNRNLAEQLKYDTAKGLQNIEMAQRTQDTPPSLQYENTAPLQYFLDLAENFEREMQLLKVKIDNTEKFVKKCNEPNVLTSQDLALGLKRLHETFVALAGRMQSVHSQVEAQKEVFLSLRKQATKDNINPFEKIDRNTEVMNAIMRNALKSTLPNLSSGPTPFNSIALGSSNVALAVQQNQTPTFTAPTTTPGFGFGTSAFGQQPSNTSLFKPAGFGTSPFQLNTSSNFQLQKPPTGNKRGKQ